MLASRQHFHFLPVFKQAKAYTTALRFAGTRRIVQYDREAVNCGRVESLGLRRRRRGDEAGSRGGGEAAEAADDPSGEEEEEGGEDD
ncbi:hypothetical protein RHGRI_008053 [Rhododendron griersonianum]|uniref:Uncharacterized protein n=1 Tax=Rhododendron griersonianum TaxID=479676 RepID=A0AAV6KZU5_9ERIC|nr:hypothetical protein RHGRI_008053 [Rhododendron griersonianum]